MVVVSWIGVALAAGVTFSVPATGRQAVVYEAGDFGRVAVTVQSGQGTALQLLDRMTGPGPEAGRVGEEDGWIDAFLDAGEIRILATSAGEGTGDAVITGTPFERGGEVPVMPRAQRRDTTLADSDERSARVTIEAR